jgi:uncharacterized protein YjgD (DUF1641 family)
MPLTLSVIILIFVCANATEKGESDEFFDALDTFEANEERKTVLQNLISDSNQEQPLKEKENEESLMEKLYQEFLEEANASMQDMSEVTPKQLAELIEKLRKEMAEFETTLPSWAQTEKPARKDSSSPMRKSRDVSLPPLHKGTYKARKRPQQASTIKKSKSEVFLSFRERMEDVRIKKDSKEMDAKDNDFIAKQRRLPNSQNLTPKTEMNPFKRLNKQQKVKLYMNNNGNQISTPRFMYDKAIDKAPTLDLHQKTFKITDKCSEIFNLKNLENQKMRFYMFLDELVTVGDENPRFANFLANEILTRRKQNEFLMSPALTKILRKKIIEIKGKEIEGMARIFCWGVDVINEEKSKLEDQLGQCL